ncbi:MAG: hypothetical protein ABFD97_26160 [Syntrophobacter sp.]
MIFIGLVFLLAAAGTLAFMMHRPAAQSLRGRPPSGRGVTETVAVAAAELHDLQIVLSGLGAGVSGVFAAVTRSGSDLSMTLNWQLFLGSGVAVTVIVLIAALVSARKVLVLEPAIVFKG